MRGEEVLVWTDGPRCCCFSPLLIFDPPNAVVTATRTLDPSVKRDVTHRQRGGTSCPSVTHYNLFPLDPEIVLWTFSLVLKSALDFEWPVSLNPQNL